MKTVKKKCRVVELQKLFKKTNTLMMTEPRRSFDEANKKKGMKHS